MARARRSRNSFSSAPTVPDRPSGFEWRVVALVLAGGAAYSNSLTGPFIFDDQLSVIENPQIRQWWRLADVLGPERELPTAGRPLVNLSFAINYALGGLNTMGYHAVNIAIHVLSALLIFGLVRGTLELPDLKPRFSGWSVQLAFAGALLWVLHPLNTEAVDYVTQRTELMMAFFYLLTLYAGLRAWQAAPARGWRVMAVAACAAGMACKESMAIAPVMVVLYDATFLFGSFRQAVASRWRLYAGLAASWVVLAAVMWSGPRVHSAGFGTGVSPWTYLLNQTVMITEYLRLSVWPRMLVANYGWPLPLTLGEVLPYALFVTALLAVTIAAAVRYPKWGFLGLWFFVTLAPASSIVPIATEVGAERRMYLPLAALTVLAAVAVPFIRRLPAAAAAILLVICSAGLGGATLARNRDYASGLALAQTVVDRRPTSFAHHLLAGELIAAGRDDEALAHLHQALPGAPRAYYALGAVLFKQGKTGEAIDALEAFVQAEPLLLEAVSARQLLGQAYAKAGRWPLAIEQHRMVLTMNPSGAVRVEAEGLLAVALSRTERFDEAVGHYQAYLNARPRDVAALTGLAVALVATDRPDAALDVFRRAADIDPGSGDLQRNLANALFDHRDVAGAAAHAERAVALLPDDPGAHDTLGRVLAVQGRLAEARAHFERALQLAPNDADAQEDLAKLRRLVAGR